MPDPEALSESRAAAVEASDWVPNRPAQKPPWLRKKVPLGLPQAPVTGILKDALLVTVCEEAHCPNLHECWSQGTATFMILGEICTRGCTYCSVGKGIPAPVAADEPTRVAEAVAAMNLRHVVITSVDRDDLPDGGAEHFVECIEAVRAAEPDCTIEVLTPDFAGDEAAIDRVIEAAPEVFNHNIETVPRLFERWRGGGDYGRSLALLARVAELAPELVTKSGFMVGLGETREEITTLLQDLRAHGVGFVTCGQYLRPDSQSLPAERYLTPDEFTDIAREAKALGFDRVASGPFVRSSYHAGELYGLHAKEA